MTSKRYGSCQLITIKASQSLSKTLLLNLPHHTCNIILVALDGVTQLGRDNFILTIYRITDG